jgi:uncharacterized protein (TIGR02001 family)
MKKLLGLAVMAGATVLGAAGAAHAEGSISGNIALTSDYVFRGVTQSSSDAAVSGGFDYTNGIFYAGTWASSVSFTNGTELDFYAGVAPEVGPFALDFGVLGYFYPGADDDGTEFDYYEASAAASIAATDALSLGAALFYSPEFFGETGEGLYLEVNGEFAASDTLSFSAAYGNQTIDDVDGPGGANTDGDYNTWNIGGTLAAHGFSFDVRYHDTDIDAGDDIQGFLGTDETFYDSAIVFTIGRDL